MNNNYCAVLALPFVSKKVVHRHMITLLLFKTHFYMRMFFLFLLAFYDHTIKLEFSVVDDKKTTDAAGIGNQVQRYVKVDLCKRVFWFV